jgi:hypothetical protein
MRHCIPYHTQTRNRYGVERRRLGLVWCWLRSAAKLRAPRSSENVELKIEANMSLVFLAICAPPMLDERIALNPSIKHYFRFTTGKPSAAIFSIG